MNNIERANQLKKNIEAFMEELRMTKADLARKLDVAPSRVTAILKPIDENGKGTYIHRKAQKKLQEAFNCTEEDLLKMPGNSDKINKELMNPFSGKARILYNELINILVHDINTHAEDELPELDYLRVMEYTIKARLVTLESMEKRGITSHGKKKHNY